MGKRISKRDMRLSDYGISPAKYNELKYFCMQHEEKKREIQRLCGVNVSVENEMLCGNTIGNPIVSQAIRRAMLQEDVELIERTTIEADSEIHLWLMKNVTEGIPYEYLDVPKARKQFYESRRYFFYLLSQKR